MVNPERRSRIAVAAIAAIVAVAAIALVLMPHDVSVTYEGNGDVDPDGGSIRFYETLEITMTPDDGWRIGSVTVDGDEVSVDGNVLDPRDAEGLFGLELRVVEAVDALLRGGHERTAAREVYPAPFVDYLIYLFAAARRREVDDLLEVLRRSAEQQAEAARDAAQIPDMHDGSRELDVPHSFAAHAVVGDFDAAALADDAAEFRAAALIFSAGAFVAPDGSEYALAEKAVLLRPERSVVDRLRLFDFPAGEFPDPLRGRKSHSYSGDFMAYVSH